MTDFSTPRRTGRISQVSEVALALRTRHITPCFLLPTLSRPTPTLLPVPALTPISAYANDRGVSTYSASAPSTYSANPTNNNTGHGQGQGQGQTRAWTGGYGAHSVSPTGRVHTINYPDVGVAAPSYALSNAYDAAYPSYPSADDNSTSYFSPTTPTPNAHFGAYEPSADSAYAANTFGVPQQQVYGTYGSASDVGGVSAFTSPRQTAGPGRSAERFFMCPQLHRRLPPAVSPSLSRERTHYLHLYLGRRAFSSLSFARVLTLTPDDIRRRMTRSASTTNAANRNSGFIENGNGEGNGEWHQSVDDVFGALSVLLRGRPRVRAVVGDENVLPVRGLHERLWPVVAAAPSSSSSCALHCVEELEERLYWDGDMGGGVMRGGGTRALCAGCARPPGARSSFSYGQGMEVSSVRGTRRVLCAGLCSLSSSGCLPLVREVSAHEVGGDGGVVLRRRRLCGDGVGGGAACAGDEGVIGDALLVVAATGDGLRLVLPPPCVMRAGDGGVVFNARSLNLRVFVLRRGVIGGARWGRRAAWLSIFRLSPLEAVRETRYLRFVGGFGAGRWVVLHSQLPIFCIGVLWPVSREVTGVCCAVLTPRQPSVLDDGFLVIIPRTSRPLAPSSVIIFPLMRTGADDTDSEGGDYLFAPPVAETVFVYPGTPAASSFNSSPNASASPFAMPMSAPTMSPDAMLRAYATKKKHTSSSTKHTSGAEVVPTLKNTGMHVLYTQPEDDSPGSAGSSESGEVLGGAAPLIRAGPGARLSR
ncbi:hypothetical protein B0H16DRAFT_1741264 [Mycena metata]|uniref:Uncharacterized protein n=1 Tax=Mycena metata TaxID=1033252 RepID=A0AAD7MGH3_9AGAR|nr:hypothetical protein B0H16DRAFT_1741264 [Mycena metata]